MTWKEFVYQQIVEYCNRMDSRTFSLQEFYMDKEDVFRAFKPANYHRMAKLRQQLQFLRDDGTRYIEVHHIIPLCKGGEDGLWNLSVLCAHHHKMAHYSDTKTRIDMENFLIKEVRYRI